MLRVYDVFRRKNCQDEVGTGVAALEAQVVAAHLEFAVWSRQYGAKPLAQSFQDLRTNTGIGRGWIRAQVSKVDFRIVSGYQQVGYARVGFFDQNESV